VEVISSKREFTSAVPVLAFAVDANAAGADGEMERTVDGLAVKMIGLAGVFGCFHGEIRSD
jgi:hypothetical protein